MKYILVILLLVTFMMTADAFRMRQDDEYSFLQLNKGNKSEKRKCIRRCMDQNFNNPKGIAFAVGTLGGAAAGGALGCNILCKKDSSQFD